MIFGGGIFALAALALWVYCIFDVIATDDSLVQHMPKMIWLLIVIFVPTVGSIAWLILGRPRNASFAPGGAAPTQQRYIGRAVSEPELPPPMDEEDYRRRREEAIRRHEEERREADRKREQELEAMRLQAWEEELRRREDEMRRKEGGEPPTP